MSDSSGHRERLKQRFLQAQGAGLADYELLELALTFAIPRRDVKPLAKALLSRFGTLHGVLTAPAADLSTFPGLGPTSGTLLQLIGSLARRIGKQKLAARPVLANRLELIDYLYTLFAGKTREEVHVLYLNNQLELITDETLFTGTLTQSGASPRDILQRALAHNAAGLVIAHNHPSGQPKPSRTDDDFTHTLDVACVSLGIQLHDHFIIGTDSHYSYKGARKL